MSFIEDTKWAEKREHPLESRLLAFFISAELVWSFLVGILYLIFKLPAISYGIYLGFCAFVIIYLTIGYLAHKEPQFARMYVYIVLIVNPFMWYFSGGGRTSSSILFISELVCFVMCLEGTKQKVFITLNLVSSGIIQNASRHLPNPVFPMDERQYQISSSVLGIATSLLIASLLIKQKREYALERENVIKSEKDLERSNSLQKNFLANMSHEIRSPLGIVMGFNDLIKDSNDIKQIHEYSQDITQAGSTLLAVINDILDYSKIESGKLDIIESDYSFDELIGEIKRDIALKCDEKGLEFIVNVDDDIPKYLKGDVIRIKQCLINVLSNAVKYTNKGTVKFDIKCSAKEADDRYNIQFIMSDTGKGISKEALPNLFTAFQRLDEGVNRGIEGTGLGMAITKNLLDEMNGTIDVESEVGVGSTFTIELAQTIGAPGKEMVVDEDENMLQGIKVLVVDDTPVNLMLVRKLLERDGAEVTTLESGRECLENVKDNIYDIILLDHMMPEMNGVEEYECLRKQGGPNKETPIVMLTANAMAGAEKEYLEMGFNGYLSKPIVPKLLRETVKKWGSEKR